MIRLEQSLNVVIIAGASGIGRCIARAYFQQNCRLFVCDVSTNFIQEFKQEFPGVFIQKTDVAGFEAVKLFFDAIKGQLDHIDVLINCAGIAGPTALLEDVTPAEWEQTMSINVNGMFYCLREAIPWIKKSTAGSIINLASSASYYGFPYRSAYCTAKWATIGMTKTLAMELGPQGIRVNAICPGSVSGDRINRVMQADALEQGRTLTDIKSLYVKQVSMRTFVDPEDVADLAIFLTSKHGRFISGQALGLDGHTEGLSTNL